MYYDIVCTKCKYQEIDFENPIGKPFPKCPNCKKKGLIKDYSSPEALPDFHVKEIKQLVQQVEANKKRIGKEQCLIKEESMLTEHDKKKKNAPKPWWWSKDQTKPLDVTKIKDVGKYIESGDKD